MTTWTTISNAAVAVGGIPSSTTVTALRDNPAAIAETSTGAPVVQAGWHPYDKVTVGDGKTGLIYDFAVNGLQANVTKMIAISQLDKVLSITASLEEATALMAN